MAKHLLRLSEALHTEGILKALWTLWAQVLKQAMEDSVQVSAITPHTSVSKSLSPCCLLARDIPSHNPLREGLSFFPAFRANVAHLGSCSCLEPESAAAVKVSRAAGTTGCNKQGWGSPSAISREQEHTCVGSPSCHPLRRISAGSVGLGNPFCWEIMLHVW